MRTIPLLVVVCLVSFPTYAKYSGGTGEPNDPYQIATAEDLMLLGDSPEDYDKHFILTADIDMDPNLPGRRVFTDALIARDRLEAVSGHSADEFVGVLDGKGHAIDNLHIEGSYGYAAGLFGVLSGVVKDLRLTNVVVSGSPCGALTGTNYHGLVARCQVTGQVSGVERVGGVAGGLWDGNLVECQADVKVTGEGTVGGMVGMSSGSLIRCQAWAEVVGVDRVGGMVGSASGLLIGCEAQAEVTGQHSVGGLVGRLGSNDQIIECRTVGIVIGTADVGGLAGECGESVIWGASANCEVSAEQVAGGLIGSGGSIFSGPFIADSYSLGSVSGSVVGGLMGEAYIVRIMNCYSACVLVALESDDEGALIGGLVGDVQLRRSVFERSVPLVIGCFWDADLSPIAQSTGSDPVLELGNGLTTVQMLEGNEFRNTGWDFSHVWMTCEGDYPMLQWEAEDCGNQQQ